MPSSKEMSLAIKIAGKVDPSFKSALSSIGSGISGVAKTLGAATAAATAAVGGIAAAAVKVGSEFESSMSQVQATMLIDTSTEEGMAAYSRLEEAARECGRTTAFSAGEAAEALNYLALAGYDADQAAEALPTILNLAGAGAMDLATASDMVTDAMSALQLEVTGDSLTTFADQLAKTASSANTSVEQLGEGILTVGATAANLAGGTTELNTALGILADVGIKGSEGGTHLRNVILKLQQPTADAAALMDDLGVSVYDAEGNMNSLQDIFGDLSAAMEGMSQADIDEIMGTLFNKTDLASANALLANCTDRWDELSDAIENSAGACEQMYEIQLDNLQGDVAKLTSGLSDLGISIYQDLNGPMRDITQLGTDMVGQLSAAYSEGGLEGMVGAIGGCMAQAIDVMGSYVPQAVSMGISLITSFVDGIAQNSGSIANIAAQTITTFVQGAAALLPQVALTGIDVILNFAQSMIGQLPTLIQAGAQAIATFAQGLGERMPQILQTGIQLIISLIQGIGSALPTIISAVISLAGSMVQAIFTIDWIQVGIDILSALANGIVGAVTSIGSTVINAVKGLFGKGDSNPEVEASGEEATASYAEGIAANAGAVSDAASSLTTDAFANIDMSAFTTAGADGVETFSLALTDNASLVTAAADDLSLGIVNSLDDGWADAQSSADTAMAEIASTTSKEATEAANAIKAAFEGMTITIPKPKIPVITTTYRTETYGEGGSIQIPEFSVHWNALGGIFNDPTLLQGAQGVQGVGEAGPEAVLPLSTLWDEIRDIFREIIQETSGPDLLDTLLDKISSIGTGGGGTSGEAILAGGGGPSVTYAPVYNLYGNATRDDAVQAEKISQADFARLMKEYERNNSRTKF